MLECKWLPSQGDFALVILAEMAQHSVLFVTIFSPSGHLHNLEKKM